ncbi:MAG: shikimate kinase [Flavobacteriales bacterium]|nr:MAG: shikimate kinase [Flavobacteriales bacterium]
MPFERLVPIEEITVGGQRAVVHSTQVLAHLHHARVEVADPGEHRVPIEFLVHDVFLGMNDQGAFIPLALEFLGHPEHNARHGLHRAGVFVPQEFQLAPPVEVAVHMFEDLVQLGQADVHRHGSFVVADEDDQPRVHHGLHRLHEFQRGCGLHGFVVVVVHPGRVIHRTEVLGDTFHAQTACIVHPEGRIVHQLVVLAVEDGLDRYLGTAQEEELVEVDPEPVVFQQLLVVRRIVVGAVDRWRGMVLDQQPPEHVAIAQVDGAVHRLHAMLLEPVPGGVQQQVSGRLIVDALEEAHASRGLFLRVGRLGIDEGRDPPDARSIGAQEDPAHGLAVLQELVLPRVEHLLHILLQVGDPVLVLLVYPPRKPHPPGRSALVRNRYDLHRHRCEGAIFRRIMRHVMLIGFMCSGKSRVGRELAPLLGLPFHDLDRAIEARVGPIKPFFEGQGEMAFRAEEVRVLEDLLALPPAVIAMGGGTPCHGGNLARMKRAGTLVCLDVPMDVLMPRIIRSGGDRPLLAGLKGDALHARVSAMLAERQPVYAQAHHQVRADGTPAEVAQRIVAALQVR